MRVTIEPYGDPAFEALARALTALQDGDPLRRATVVVPRGPVGLAARRRLAARPGGLLNVRFLTLPGLAAELAVPWLSAPGRQPATRAVVQEAVRAVLADTDDGLLAPVRDQLATVRALALTYRELRGASPAILRVLSSQGERAAEVVRLVTAVRERLADRFDETTLVEAAAAEVAKAAGVGPVVVYLPVRLGPADRDLLRAIDERVPVTVIVGATGDAVADEPARELVAPLGGRADPAAFSTTVVQGTEVLAAPTADAEVLLAVRHLMARNAAGIPLERMAVAHSGHAPYPRLVHDVLTRAGIPFNGAGIRPLAATVTGRTLLGALELADHDWRRDNVTAWLTSAPLLDGRGRPVPGDEWDALSRRAGVVAGLAEWRDRPVTYAAALRARAAQAGDDDQEAEQCDAMAAFVEDLARRLVPPSGTWAQCAQWARRLLLDLLGEAAHQADWPPGEVAAHDAVLEAIQGLTVLGDGHPGPTELRTALAAELEGPAPQASRFGHGILVGRIAEMVGLDVDVLCVVGMVDGSFPGRVADDVLVPDREREACGGEIPLRGGRPSEDRRDYLAALAGAGERVLSYATGDQREGRELRPSRLLLDSLGALVGSGRRLYARDLPTIEAQPGYITVPSFAVAVSGDAGEPVSERDWDLRALLRWTETGGDPGRHFLSATDAVLGSGLELRRGRRATVFTRYDGRVDDVAVPSPAEGGAVQSPTGLEAFARCPRSYLFRSLLGVEVREAPEAILRISALERGNLVHRVLERFIAEELALPDDRRIAPDTPWGPAGEARLDHIAGEVFADFERRGLTGRDALWHIDRSAILGELRHFLRQDDRYRRETGAVPEAVETYFGRDGGEPVTVSLGGGREVRFRGKVDRIDRTVDGGITVLDYKTGSRRKPEDADDPVERGTKLQLPVYGLAARRRYGPPRPVDLRYWYVGGKVGGRGHYPQEGFTLTPPREERFVEVVDTLVSAVEGGRLPGNPAGCGICDFNGICPSDRLRSWERKRADPWIDDYRALAEPS